MRFTGWLLAAAVMVTPAFARGQAVLDQPHAMLGHGVSLVVSGRFAEAEKPLREALRLDPTLSEGHYNLAIALLSNRTWPRREESADAIKQLRPLFHDAVMEALA